MTARTDQGRSVKPTIKASRKGLVQITSRPATEADGLRVKQDGNRFSVTFDADMSITLLEGLRKFLRATCPPETWPTVKKRVRLKDGAQFDVVLSAFPRDQISLAETVARALGQIDLLEQHLKKFRKAPEHELRGRGEWLIEKSLNLAFKIWDVVLLENELAIANSIKSLTALAAKNSDEKRRAALALAPLQRKANEIWARRPSLSASAVAGEIFPGDDGKSKARRNTLRRQIQKPVSK